MSVAELQRVLGQHYRVERELGAGGMATVYLAHDPKHERRVAIKVLRPELAAIVGGERFLKEIRTTANLQHPHILPLHDSGDADGLVYYVMPYVEGESLRQRLQRDKQLPVDEAVRIAREVASGLDYAHRHGVVHRDIKPENILLHDGTALVVDFGIALAMSRSEGATRMTETGMSLGTPNYMSPEQAMGEREITPRSDVYALGAVLYEMLVGEPPFTGPTPQAIFARVLTDEPRPLTVQRRTIPAHVEAAVMTALAKLPADRFATAAHFADALARPFTTGPAASAGRAAPARGVWKPAALVVAGAALVALGALAGRSVARVSPSAAPPGRFSIRIPTENRLSTAPFGTIALSPDGSMLAYVGEGASGQQLYLRRLDDLAVTPIQGTEGGFNPSFSPDGAWIVFGTGSAGRKVPVGGGSAITMGAFGAVAGLSGLQALLWVRPDEYVVTSADGTLGWYRSTGTLDTIAVPDSAELALLATDIMPDGRLIVIGATQGLTGPVWIMDPHNGRRTLVTRQLAGAAGYHDGHIAWVLPTGALVAAKWDDRGEALAGATHVIAPNVRITPGSPPQITFSRKGSLAYVPAQPSELVRVDRTGRAEVIGGAPRRFHSPRVSPDGGRVVLDITDETRDVWVLHLRDGTMTRLTFDNDGHDPMWLPDGRSILYHSASRSATTGIYRRRADGTGVSDSVAHAALQLSAHAVTPDGAFAVAVDLSPAGDFSLVKLRLRDGRVEPLLAARFNEIDPALSPDGRWLAYVSDESGRNEVYARPLDDASGRVLVSASGGIEPVWSRNGREIFYRNLAGPSIVAAAIETRPELRVTSRTTLFDAGDYETSSPHANYDVTADGRFVLVRNPRTTELVFVQNWPELVRRRSQ